MATSNLIRRMVEDLYIPIFSQEEVDQILNGIDFYIDSDELIERLRVAFSEEEEEEQIEEVSDPKPKRTRKKKTD